MTPFTLAVLPFLNLSPGKESEYFSDGITGEIIHALARIPNLKVISRTSSFYFKNKDIPLKEIAAQLNVEAVLEGSVRIAGDRVRISAQLIQAADDFPFWSESWDRKLANIFEIQDEISLLIADKLREQFGHLELADHLVNKQTDNLDAYSYSLQARHRFNKWNPVDVNAAIALYEKAIALDPKHTESIIGLADAYGFMATTGFMPREEAWSKTATYIRQAHDLDPNNPGVHYQLSNLAFFYDCDFGKAMAHNERALELMPGYPEALQHASFLHLLAGNTERAAHHLGAALAIDPLNQETLFYRAFFLYRTSEYEKALGQVNECLAVNSLNIPALIVKAYCLLKTGFYDQVITLLDAMPEEIAIPDEQLGLRCLNAIRSGKDKTLTEQLVTRLQEEASKPASQQAHSYLFLAYTNLGAFDKAFSLLEKSLAIRSSIFLLSYSDPLADNLTRDPRYTDYHHRIYRTDSRTENPEGKKAAIMDAAAALAHKEKLLDFVERENTYLNPNLSLRLLAGQLGMHPNNLSWLLNEQLGKNFNQFINHYRVEHFKSLANDPANDHISLIGLAFESGFNSKTVFNTFFKKETGTTPSAYLKSLRPERTGSGL